MAVCWRHVESIKGREWLELAREWVTSEVSEPEDIVCLEWDRFATKVAGKIIRAIPQDSFVNIAKPIHQQFLQDIVDRLVEVLAPTLVDRLVLAPTLNPVLQSALAAVRTANNLTVSELLALNSLIGGAPIQNEFDIEAFYSKEDEVSS